MLTPWLIRIAAVALHNRAHGLTHHLLHIIQHNHKLPHGLIKLLESRWFAELVMVVAMFAIGVVLDAGVERVASPFEEHKSE